MSKNESDSNLSKDEVLSMVDGILQPDYKFNDKKIEFSSFKEMNEHLTAIYPGVYEISESTLTRHLRGTHFVKIDNKFTISPMYYRDQYRDMLKRILKFSTYKISSVTSDGSVYTLATDDENDILIVELIKKAFPFEAVGYIKKNYRLITISFNLDAFSEDDQEFLEDLF